MWTCPLCGVRINKKGPHCQPGMKRPRKKCLCFLPILKRRILCPPLTNREAEQLEADLASQNLPPRPREMLVRLLAMVRRGDAIL